MNTQSRCSVTSARTLSVCRNYDCCTVHLGSLTGLGERLPRVSDRARTSDLTIVGALLTVICERPQ
jgi:hypothetical protein